MRALGFEAQGWKLGSVGQCDEPRPGRMIAGKVDNAGMEDVLMLEVAVLDSGHRITGDLEVKPDVPGQSGVGRSFRKDKALQGGIIGNEQPFAVKSGSVEGDSQAGDGGVDGLLRAPAG